jgi:hypothetical protein
MQIKKTIIVAMIALFVGTAAGAQSAKHPTPPASPVAAAAGDTKSVIFNWMWYSGMLRGIQENDEVASLELQQSTGTVMVNKQACKLSNYRASINYQIGGMRVQYACTTPDGQAHKAIEVVNGQFAWDEDKLGAGLTPGNGTATPIKDAVNERLIRLWAGPQGAAKSAAAGGANTKVAVEGGKAVVNFPIPGVPGAMAKATLNAKNMAEKVEVRQGSDVTEFTYENYADYNPADDKVFGFLPGHIVEKKNGVTILDLTVKQTEVGNMYVVMPVPDNVRKAFQP